MLSEPAGAIATPPEAGVRLTHRRGLDLLRHPALNKGTAFSARERRCFGLEGLLPAEVESLEQQVERCWQAFQALEDPLQRFQHLEAIRRSNLVLFHRFLAAHLPEALPVVYTPTVGAAIQSFSRSYRTPVEGIFLSAQQRGRLRQVLRESIEAPVDLVLVTDSEGVLGLGDQGVGGIHICQGKLAVYTLCAGLVPERMLAVTLDVGTNREALLADPLYPGLRQPRLRGEAYRAFVDEFVDAVASECPGACLHWEDFGTATARPLLERHRWRLPSFNDDIQGTSGVASAAVLAACRGLGQRLRDQRIVIFGAGTAGCGIAEGLIRLLQAEGCSDAEARAHLWAIDRQGLLLRSMADLSPMAASLARDPAELASWPQSPEPSPGLEAVVAQIRPTVLIGTSTVGGAFSETIVRTMAGSCARPVILPLSNPTALAEATPSDLLRWSDGRALVATGSPFGPVDGRTIGQCNNCFLFPGLGLAAVAMGLTAITDAMIDAGLQALADHIPASHHPDAALMPSLEDAPAVARAVAAAVARQALREGATTRSVAKGEVDRLLEQTRWNPDYRPLAAAPLAAS